MIAIVDYGAGNLVSVKKAFDWLGQQCAITSDLAEVRRARKIVLPGVGHFATTSALTKSGLRDAIIDSIQTGVPFLGICVGMQWMFSASDESPEAKGLALFDRTCGRFPKTVKSPHVGWNEVQVSASSRLFKGVSSGSFVYFTHSYRAPVMDATVACSDYGGIFTAAVERDHLFGVQFHPEKSGDIGLRLLKNFCEL